MIRLRSCRNSLMAAKGSECDFAIDRSSPMSLVDQIYRAMRERIFAGGVKIGSSVPSLRSLASSLGVSVKVTVEAYARLVRDGWLRSVPRAGYLAVTPEMPLRRGRVLLVLPNEGFYTDWASHRFQERCEAIGIQVSRVVVVDPEDVPVSLDLALADAFDFAVSFHFKRRVVDTLDESGIPYVVVAADDSAVRRCKNCLGVMTPSAGAAAEVATVCAKRGVRLAELVDFHEVRRPYLSALSRAGIAVKKWIIEPERRTLWFEDIPRTVMRAFLKRLSSRRPALPDLLFFLDDYVTEGALMALAASGVRVPEDVKVLTLANRGNCPVYVKELSRIECDPLARGDFVSDFVIGWFEGRREAPPPLPPPVFVEGETI